MAEIVKPWTLEEIKADPTLKRYFKNKVRIWSKEWGLWWGKNSNGYTDNKLHAGTYTIEEALKKSGHCGPEKGIVYYPIHGIDDPEGFEKLGKVYGEVKMQRVVQDERWGVSKHHPLEWLSILGEETGKVCKAANEAYFKGYESTGNWDKYRTELISVAAVAIAAIECLDRNRDKGEDK